MLNYDLTVHMDEDGDPILEGTSPAGVEYTDKLKLRGNIPASHTLVIGCTAEEFLEEVPRNLTVGMMDKPTGMTQKLCPPLLH